MRNKTYNSNCALSALADKSQIDLLHLSGVYKLSFEGSEKFYVGSTTGSLKLRFLRHFISLKAKNHYNNILQKAFTKYEKKIVLEILEVCKPEDCISREQFHIDALKPEYNICQVAGNTFGIKPSEKCLLATSRKVDMFDVDGNFIKTFKSRNEAFRETGISSACIVQAVRKKILAQRFQFRNHGKFSKLPRYEKSTSQKILQYSLDGEFIKEYPSMLEASKLLSIPVGNISKHLSDKTDKCYGFIFKKYESNYPLKIKDYVRHHKLQKQIEIEDLTTGKIMKFSSLRSVDSKIINRSTLINYQRKGFSEFVAKKRYKIQIKAHDPNEVMEIL